MIILWSVLLLPFFAAIICKFLKFKSTNMNLFYILGLLSLLSFIGSILIYYSFVNQQNNKIVLSSYIWLKAGSFRMFFELVYDQLSGIFVMVITAANSIIHLINFRKKISGEMRFRFLAIHNSLVFTLLLATLSKSMPAALITWQGAAVFAFLLGRDTFPGKIDLFLNFKLKRNVKPNTKVLIYLSRFSKDLDNKLIDRLTETTLNLVSTLSGILSFSMQGSTQRHASMMIIGLIILSALTFSL